MTASRLVNIHMDNFGGLQDTEGSKTIGTFGSFTILLGGTGFGKSTTVRAIAFALGDMPGSKTTESGRVTLTVGRGMDEKVFERFKDQENDSYFVDKAAVSERVYLRQLRSEGVNPDMRKNMVHINGSYADLVLREDSDIAAILEEQLGTSNLKKKYDKLSKKLESAIEKSENSDAEDEKTEKVKQLEKELEGIKETRRNEFEKLFLPLAARLDLVYKSIYDCQRVSLKMVPTVKNEPYLGLTFECLPYHHGDKLIDIELLSGGEKKVASVAFLLALNLVKGSPFVVLDELDKAFHKDTCIKMGPALQQMANDIQVVAVCNDKHMRRFATKRLLVKLEDD